MAGLADPDESGRMKHAEDAGAARTYADYREMLGKEKPDLVSIGPRWTVRHKEYLLACTEIGAHGYLEKPIAVDGVVENLADPTCDLRLRGEADLASAARAGLVPEGMTVGGELAVDVRARVVRGGVLRDRKGINMPGVRISAPSVTEKDLGTSTGPPPRVSTTSP